MKDSSRAKEDDRAELHKTISSALRMAWHITPPASRATWLAEIIENPPPFDEVFRVPRRFDDLAVQVMWSKLKNLAESLEAAASRDPSHSLVQEQKEQAIALFPWLLEEHGTQIKAKIEADTRESMRAEYDPLLLDRDQQIANLERELATIRTTVQRNATAPQRTGTAMFALLLLLCVVITVVVVYAGWANAPNVNIEYNVGELIGGILGGSGIAVAGGAYAIRTLREPERR